MSLSERRQRFERASRADPLVTAKTKFHKLFGVSNSAKVIPGGLQLGVVNLDTVADTVDGFAFACTMVFPPEDEVYFTVYVRSGAAAMIERLKLMKRLGAGELASDGGGEEELDLEATDSEEQVTYGKRNNLAVVVLGPDAQLYVRNKGFWNELPRDRSGIGPAVPVDKINVALYPPAPSSRRSLLARELVGYLGNLIGREKVHELRVWDDASAVRDEMLRMPSTIPIDRIESAVRALGGYYPGGEVRRLHAALNFLTDKHFVILSGLSGTGKTQLITQYARAVHGLNATDADPFLFICPVRPEWTDPTGLTGYYDVLSNRYMVPPFLEAMLLATAHRHSPVFVILDEMNLARVEYYLADILSAIETRDAIRLHSHGIPLEGSTGVSVPAALPVPPNLYIVGTINIDETTNPISDKVLDRACVIDMSKVDLAGFLAELEGDEPALAGARAACGAQLLAVHADMAEHGLGFGYRTVEEALRYHAFCAAHTGSDATAVTDELMVQKVLVKLRGSERQRPLLTSLAKTLSGMPRSEALLSTLTADLDEFGAFQASR